MKLFNKKNTDLEEHLEDGGLPWGWIYRNREFCDKIRAEYIYFCDNLIEAKKKKDDRVLYSALKSFVIYLEDVEKLCKSKGECFEFWFTEILTAPGWVDCKKAQLQDLYTKIYKPKGEN